MLPPALHAQSAGPPPDGAAKPAAEDAAKPAAPEAAKQPAPPMAMASLGWLAGCWKGSVNQRDFREQWMPLRGDLLLGAGHTVTGGKTQEFEFLRIEPRPDGIHYVAQPGGSTPTAFKFASVTTDGPDVMFTFVNEGHDFPQRIVYRRATGGWLYVHVEGKLKGEDKERRVIYPFRRVDCESDEVIARD